jgi:hypothetical protein
MTVIHPRANWAHPLSMCRSAQHKVLTLLPKKADPKSGYDAGPTKAKLTERGKHIINEKDVHVLLSNYGSGYTPYVAKAGEELGRVVLGPGLLPASTIAVRGFCWPTVRQILSQVK